MDALLGDVTGFLLQFTVILLVGHWIARKIRRKPRKSFRYWLTSWVAGPELLLLGMFYVVRYANNPYEQHIVVIAFFPAIDRLHHSCRKDSRPSRTPFPPPRTGV